MSKIHEKSTGSKSNWWHWPVTFAFLALFISLGFWQLHRAEIKQDLESAFKTRLNSPPITLSQLEPKKTDIQYYPIKANGYYDTQYSYFLDNKTYKGQVGYEVITLFHSEREKKALLVNRGWVPAGADRSHLPVIKTPNTAVFIAGSAYQPSARPFLLSHADEKQTTWPKRIEAIQLDKISQALDQPIYPFVFLLSKESLGGFVRDWQPVSMPSYKHIGYAVQWFSFAITLFIIVVVLKQRSKKHERKQH